MAKRIGKLGLIILVATLMLLNGSAHEWVHSFAGHTDNKECKHPEAGQHFFDTEHHHCALLDLQLPVCFLTDIGWIPAQPDLLFWKYRQKNIPAPLIATIYSLPLRGPPAMLTGQHI